MLFFVLPTEICTHLNSKDQDSLADHMAKMKREAKESKIEREVQGFRESLHLAKTTFYISAILMGKCQFNIHVQETPRASLAHRKQISFPLAFFKRTIPFFYPVDNILLIRASQMASLVCSIEHLGPQACSH